MLPAKTLKTMDRSKILYGQAKTVKVSDFGETHWKALQDIVKEHLGERERPLILTAKKFINAAKTNESLKNAPVKAGIVDGHLVVRVVPSDTDVSPVEAVFVQNYVRKELRARVLIAAQKAKKLGVGPHSQQTLEEQGLTPMDQRYWGEVQDDKKNRYGRYLPPLKTLWDTHASRQLSFSQWLDAVEGGDTGVPGVTEALAASDGEIGRIVGRSGVAGGAVEYLDETARARYAAQVRAGDIRGGVRTPASASYIFVIGSDNNVYVGVKRRGSDTQKAFNHSSFFSGGAVRSAGTVWLRGDKIIKISNESGHYTPTEKMIRDALSEFTVGSTTWLDEVQVEIGGRDRGTGTRFMAEDARGSVTSSLDASILRSLTTSAGYRGKLARDRAEAYLADRPGAWLLREGRNGVPAISYNDGRGLRHSLLTDQSAYENYQSYISTRANLQVTRGLPELRRHTFYHPTLNTNGAEIKLTPLTDGSWLLRVNGNGGVTFSYKEAGRVKHLPLVNEADYAQYIEFSRAHRAQSVKA